MPSLPPSSDTLPQRKPLHAVDMPSADALAYILACLRLWASNSPRCRVTPLGTGAFDYLWMHDEH